MNQESKDKILKMMDERRRGLLRVLKDVLNQCDVLSDEVDAAETEMDRMALLTAMGCLSEVRVLIGKKLQVIRDIEAKVKYGRSL